jgi:hypothetical protein
VGLAGVVYAGRRASAKFYGCALGRSSPRDRDRKDRSARAGWRSSSRRGRGVGARRRSHREDVTRIVRRPWATSDRHDLRRRRRRNTSSWVIPWIDSRPNHP